MHRNPDREDVVRRRGRGWEEVVAVAVQHLAPMPAPAVPAPAREERGGARGATGEVDVAAATIAAGAGAGAAATAAGPGVFSATRGGAAAEAGAGLTSAAVTVARAVTALTAELRAAERLAEKRAGEKERPDPARAEEWTVALRTLDSAASVLAVTRAGLAGLVRSTDRWRGTTHARDFADWRGAGTRQGRGAALGEERVVTAMTLLPEIKEAARSGAITHGHLNVVAGVLGGVSENTRERLRRAETEILEAARELPVPQLRRNLTALAAAWEADAADAAHHEVRAHRYLRLKPQGEAIRIDGLLDVVAGEILRTALEALTPAPVPSDTRTPDQRRADALTDLAGHALSTGSHKAGAQIRPHLSVLLREDTFHLLRTRQRTTGDGGGARPTSTALPIAGRTGEALLASGLAVEPPLGQLNTGTLLPYAALEVLACDALVQRLVVDPTGQPLDVGRTARTYTGDLRRAVQTRDRHCQWPGCTLRATWCEVHHLHHWAHGGTTSLANAITLCSHHHHEAHREEIRIAPHPTGFAFSRPDSTPIGTTTRLDHSLLTPRVPDRSPHPASAVPATRPGPAGRTSKSGQTEPSAPPAQAGPAGQTEPSAPPAQAGKADPVTTSGRAGQAGRAAPTAPPRPEHGPAPDSRETPTTQSTRDGGRGSPRLNATASATPTRPP